MNWLGQFANSNLRGCAIRLIEVDILERLFDRFFFGFLEELLELGFEDFGFIFFRFSKLFVFFVAPAGFSLDLVKSVLHVHYHLRFDRHFVV